MKRKIDDTGEPVAEAPLDTPASGIGKETATEATDVAFTDFNLDPRLLVAIASEGFKVPTLVQREAIPPALQGKDVLAKAKTGSGKTVAYLLPVLQAILRRKQSSPKSSFIAALILVPTKELASQVHKVVQTVTQYCAKDIEAAKITDNVGEAVQRSILASLPDVVVSTPSRAWTNISSGAFNVDELTHLVVDEADLVLSYNYEEDLQNLSKKIPKRVQAILTSATLPTEVVTLRDMFCRDPVVLDLEEEEEEGEGVSQFVVKCGEAEKFLLIYVIYKLNLLKGKSIIFVADIDRCYRLKLFFEQFGIRSCILNSELPVNSRIHVVEQFNRQIYDIIIASDENEVIGDEETSEAAEDDKEEDKNDEKSKEAEAGAGAKKMKQKMAGKNRDKEYGVSRGIDFKDVACVVNFDLPTSAKSYAHRIGRTARAGQRGMALSFAVPRELYRKHVPTSVESAEKDEKVLARIGKQQAKRGKEVKPYVFDMDQVEAFRYRMNDALRAVTRGAVREARTRELREELLRSDKLKRHFEENPDEMHHVRHDGELRAARTQQHLKHVPGYLLPAEGRKALAPEDVGFVPLRKDRDRKKYTGKGGGKPRGRSFKATKGRKKNDPLKSFKLRARK